MKRGGHDGECPLQALARQLREAPSIGEACGMDNGVDASERFARRARVRRPCLLWRDHLSRATLAPARSHSVATPRKRANPAASLPCPCSVRHAPCCARRRATAAPIPDPPPVMIVTLKTPALVARATSATIGAADLPRQRQKGPGSIERSESGGDRALSVWGSDSPSKPPIPGRSGMVMWPSITFTPSGKPP